MLFHFGASKIPNERQSINLISVQSELKVKKKRKKNIFVSVFHTKLNSISVVTKIKKKKSAQRNFYLILEIEMRI